ncbi:unnamed protein product [Clonostachys rosea f. rosea IK726]|uniref:Uncharacterized protein n=2 Tax=Bionectria ochroleuca TaxID=29856 RepID=A0A0B7KLK8_BIOOC|nr:unnamed protein product [Clonostachys rosea f. rosea IK726]
MKCAILFLALALAVDAAKPPGCNAQKTCGFLVPGAETECRDNCARNGNGKAERLCNNCCTSAAATCFTGIGNSQDFCESQFAGCH